MYTTEYYSALKKNGVIPLAATWMDLETIKLSEVSQTEEDKDQWYHLLVGSKMNLSIKQKQTHKHRRQTCTVAKWEGVWGTEGFGVWDQQIPNRMYGMNKQQGPTALHRELYSMCCDKPK